MAVVASFTHDGDLLIPPSQLVTFTDTSTGSPNKWLWDFGDGETSNLQHPSHTFVGEGLDMFNVTLKAWLTASETGLGMGLIAGTAKCTWKRVTGAQPPDQEAIFNASNAFNTLSTSRTYAANMNDTNAGSTFRDIIAVRTQWSQTPTSNALKIPIVRIPLLNGESWLNRYPRGLEGTCILKRSEPGTWPGLFSPVAAQGAIGIGRNIEFDLSPWRGTPSWFMVTSSEQTITADEGDAQERGFLGYPVQIYNMDIASGDDVDSDIQQLTFGAPPVADFTASPTGGGNPLIVQFQNLSTPAVGLPTTYSWKKRVSESGDAFVQFSTEENPLHDFSK